LRSFCGEGSYFSCDVIFFDAALSEIYSRNAFDPDDRMELDIANNISIF
jgi:hypothetical protein